MCALASAVAARADEPTWAAKALQDRAAAEGRGGDQHANPDWISRTAPQIPAYFAGDESVLHDPYRADWGTSRGEIRAVTFTNRYGARLVARMYRPRRVVGRLPAIVFVPGYASQGEGQTEGFAAEPLIEQIAEAGYVVLKFEPQGQGGSQLDPSPRDSFCGPHPGAWWRQPQEVGLVERQRCAGHDDPRALEPGTPTSDALYDALGPLAETPLGISVLPAALLDEQVAARTEPETLPPRIAPHFEYFRNRFVFGALDAVKWLESDQNPWRNVVDTQNVGIAGHSAGADAAVIAGNGDPQERFKAAVAWDSHGRPPATMPARVPTMLQLAEQQNFLGPWIPKPDPELWSSYEIARKFRDAGVPSSVIALRGSTHQEWNYIPYALVNPVAPLTNSSSLGHQVAAYYTVAWFDRFLKPGGAQRDDAERRLFAAAFDDSTDRTNIGQGTYDPATQRNVPYRIGGRRRSELLSRTFHSSMSIGHRACLDLQAQPSCRSAGLRNPRPALAPSAIRLSLRPRRARVGMPTRFRFRASYIRGGKRRPISGALIRFAGRRVRTDRQGRASMVVRFRRAGRRRAVVSKPGFRRASVRVRVLRPARQRRYEPCAAHAAARTSC